MERRTGLAIATLSTGDVAIANVEKRSTTVLQTWKAHELEAWCGAWRDSNVVLTGGDDALLKIWDLRDPDGNAQIQNKRSTRPS
jgi:WD40 repeat protein